jgi:hypothetical protein
MIIWDKYSQKKPQTKEKDKSYRWLGKLFVTPLLAMIGRLKLEDGTYSSLKFFVGYFTPDDKFFDTNGNEIFDVEFYSELNEPDDINEKYLFQNSDIEYTKNLVAAVKSGKWNNLPVSDLIEHLKKQP